MNVDDQQKRRQTTSVAASTGGSGSDRSQLLVVGGQQRNPAGMRELDQQWYGYGQGVVINVADGVPSLAHTYRSAPGTCGPGDPELLKSSTLVGDRLYACTQTEAMVFSLPDFALLKHVSHPVLNDLHHIVPSDDEDTVFLAVSGQDMVMELGFDGEIRSCWGVDGSDPLSRIEPSRDYRLNTRLKPHRFHPNYLFYMPDGALWVTRFEKRDAVQVGDLTRRIDVAQERCHDGVVDGDRVYFTTVDGHVVAADVDSLDVVGRHKLAGKRDDTLLGWCRGLTFIGDHALVGFSRIRHTKVRGALSWVRNGLSASEPTRLAVYDRSSWKLVDEIDLEPAGCNAIFTIADSSDVFKPELVATP